MKLTTDFILNVDLDPRPTLEIVEKIAKDYTSFKDEKIILWLFETLKKEGIELKVVHKQGIEKFMLSKNDKIIGKAEFELVHKSNFEKE